MAADEAPATGSPVPSARRSPVVSASNSLEPSMKPASNLSGTAKSDDAKLELTESDFQLTNGCPDVKVEKKEQPVPSSPSDDNVTPLPKPRQLRLSDHSNSASGEGVLEDELLQSYRKKHAEGTVTQEDMAQVIDKLVKICQELKGENKVLQDQVKTAESERKKREENVDRQISTLSSRNDNADEKLSGLTEAQEDLQEKADTFTEMHRETKERQDASECEISAMKASQSSFEFQVEREFSDTNIRISQSESNMKDRYEGLSAANRCQILQLRNDVREKKRSQMMVELRQPISNQTKMLYLNLRKMTTQTSDIIRISSVVNLCITFHLGPFIHTFH
ncbi:hypothetical protein EB796_025288 [Bugula neritina]|uniref:Uncharacterized protein n=1 Tax=Bugula neritina TaxID=10212 RepID=A0A7J7ISN6_BUGNE|nr:hypothetical protein EB796_025288 [Bugula neritina]